ncbi:MAG: ATP-binding protein [Pirellulales bacterium]
MRERADEAESRSGQFCPSRKTSLTLCHRPTTTLHSLRLDFSDAPLLTGPNMTFNGIALKARNIKCFGDEPFGFDEIKPINIAIGRNNSGKSTLLDLVQFAIDPKSNNLNGHLGRTPEAIIGMRPTPEQINKTADIVRIRVSSNEQLDVRIRQAINKEFNESQVVYHLTFGGTIVASDILGYAPTDDCSKARLLAILSELGRYAKNPFEEYKFRRIAADRDLVPEPDANNMNLAADGTGLTSIIRRFLTRHDLDRDLVEVEFRDALNLILRPDSDFSRIGVRDLGDGPNSRWEIYLDELKKERSIPLSQTGSGLKTVMLVLGNLLIVPHIEKRDLKTYFFGFEELENNLHPAAQRRLFRFLKDYADVHGCHFFLTTHSNVVIDLFANDDMAQIIHVSHDGVRAQVNGFSSANVGWNILDDLDVRASDILQANAVIWVEGPSDRIYVNAWIELWSDGRLQPGVHFQCLPYGGSCEKHMSFEPDVLDDLIEALHINRHAIFMADSDRTTVTDPLKSDVDRLLEEVIKVDGIGFITEGREVENYIPLEAWRTVAEKPSLLGPDKF